MPITANPIDLTTLAKVRSWLGLSSAASTTDDQTIQDAITAFSAYVLRLTGRGPADGSIPSLSPFVTPVNYDEIYDGSGTDRQALRNWPITAVASVSVNGSAIRPSTSFNVPGFVIDGDAKFISIRGASSNPASFQNYGFQGCRNSGMFGRGFSAGVQNVEVVYTAGFVLTPLDLEMAARKIVALNYKRKDWIGQRSQQMANGAGTVMYNTWEMDYQDERVLEFYRRRAI